MHGIIYERAAKRAEIMDAYAPAIYPTHVDKISEALMKGGSEHSSVVNNTALTTMYFGARPCEPENPSLWGMQDDDEFSVLKGPLLQIKTLKRRRRRPSRSCQRQTVTGLGTWRMETTLLLCSASLWSTKRIGLTKSSLTLCGSSLNCRAMKIRARG